MLGGPLTQGSWSLGPSFTPLLRREYVRKGQYLASTGNVREKIFCFSAKNWRTATLRALARCLVATANHDATNFVLLFFFFKFLPVILLRLACRAVGSQFALTVHIQQWWLFWRRRKQASRFQFLFSTFGLILVLHVVVYNCLKWRFISLSK